MPKTTTKSEISVSPTALEILLVEDEATIRMTLADDLKEAGHTVTDVAQGNEALRLIGERSFDLVITDVRLPEADGHTILKRVKEAQPTTEVIMVTGFGTIESAVEAMREGAYHFILKPFLNEDILGHVARIAKLRQLESDNAKMKDQLGMLHNFDGIIGRSRAMTDVLKQVRTVARTDATILIEGESGTGKEVIARAIHYNSGRKDGPYVALSCAALPESLIEAELFGHEKGAFTDARKERRGRFEQAHGGTLFLDDVDDLELSIQVKLLRAIQEREIERVGGEGVVPVDIRLVVATKRSLEDMMSEGKFRQDLYYRLNVVNLPLPPLRDRVDDIPPLVQHFVQLSGGEKGYVVKPEVMESLMNYPWPGNVRELENAVERAIALAGDSKILKKENLIRPSKEFRGASQVSGQLQGLKAVVEDAEKAHIRVVLKATSGHKAQAASILGISRKNLWEKCKEYGIDES